MVNVQIQTVLYAVCLIWHVVLHPSIMLFIILFEMHLFIGSMHSHYEAGWEGIFHDCGVLIGEQCRPKHCRPGKAHMSCIARISELPGHSHTYGAEFCTRCRSN